VFSIADYKVIFWDFDGVIKDSVDVKTDAFVRLFDAYGPEIKNKVREHHLANGGMSRFDKFPVYMGYVGEEPTSQRVLELSEAFSQIVFQNVINAPWVHGAKEFLRENRYNQLFILVSATPSEELIKIVEELGLRSCFYEIYGAPASKGESINHVMRKLDMKPAHCVMIGDAKADMDAADNNNISFVFRKHTTNQNLLTHFKGVVINDLTEV
jgi:phosphoglycolate phosphatase-like HAD superfamily hydrolase